MSEADDRADDPHPSADPDLAVDLPANHPQASEADWQRLDSRMLLVRPIKEIGRFLPVLVGVFVAGSASGGGGAWQLLAVLVPIAIGVLRYLTTSYRIGPGRVELRRGLFNRHVLSTSLDRVRTVDLTASLVHRLLGLATVRIGTGTAAKDADDDLELDGLPIGRARELRTELLHVRASATDEGQQEYDGTPTLPVEREVLRVDLGWLRYAPLTSSGLVVTAALLGGGSQLLNELDLWSRLDPGDWAIRLSFWVGLAVGALLLLVSVTVVSMGGYLVSNWEFRLSHVPGSWHVARGLFTTRETSIDDERMAGVSIAEPLGLRSAGAARMTAIVTGLRRDEPGPGGGTSSALLVPPAPRSVVLGVAGEVLGGPAPVTATLREHGPAAARRRYARAVGPALLVLLGVLAVVLLGWLPWGWLVPAALLPLGAVPLAADRARALGHALVSGHLVSRSGSLLRSREVLATEHVIGCNLRSTWFQRRAGLTTLVVTTAGGPQSVTVADVPEVDAERLLGGLLPAVVDQFRHRP